MLVRPWTQHGGGATTADLLSQQPQPQPQPQQQQQRDDDHSTSLAPSVQASQSLSRFFGMDFSYHQMYETQQRLRSGSFGTVYTCQHRLSAIGGNNNDKKAHSIKSNNTNVYAVKIMDRKHLQSKNNKDGAGATNSENAVFYEVNMLRRLREQPHVIKIIDFFVEPDHLYLVMEYASGGDVFDRLSRRTNFTEKDARDLARTLLQAIQGMHACKVCHRDLKPENLLLRNQHDDTNIILADFGFARIVEKDKGLRTRCGTPAFVAPEILTLTGNNSYGMSVDLWSAGCILYMIIGGYAPFSGKNHRELFRKVRASDFVFHETHWKNVSIAAKRVIAGLLTVNVEKRWTCKRALESAWFSKVPVSQLQSTDLSCSIDELRKFKPRQKWKSAVKALGFVATAPFWKPDAVSFAQQMASWDRELLESNNNGRNSRNNSNSPKMSSNSQTGLVQKSSLTAKVSKIKFSDVYTITSDLRNGSYASVKQCQHKQTGETFAVKIIDRRGLQPKDDEGVLNEVAIMQSLTGQKYVVQLLDFYEEPDFFYMVLEYMSGGDVFDRIVQRTYYTEKDARDLSVILLKAVASLHRRGIAHRDIKPQNLLLESQEDNAKIKIADFGFSRRVHVPESLSTRVGTPTYVAPEILKNIPHDQRADLWSIGVVIFVLLVGYPPFMEDSQTKLFQKIRNGEWEFFKKDWDHISDEAKQLICGLLVVDPNERWSVEEALRSKWIQQDPSMLSDIDLIDSLQSMRKRRSRLRSLAKAFLWTSKDSKAMIAGASDSGETR